MIMPRRTLVVVMGLVLLLGIGVGRLTAAKKPSVTPALWVDNSPEETAAALMAVASPLAGTGSWENINVGRVHYLSGNKTEGEAIFSRYTGDQAIASDMVRIARVYAQAKEWETAAKLYDRILQLKPTDADWLAEAGAWHNLNGDRDKAEELFARSFSRSSSSLRNTLAAAGSYAGVEPRQR
jgi:tetratricopeptide (TPR) repeat protein